MRYKLLFISLFLLAHTASAQSSPAADSIMKLITKSKEDTNRVKLLLSLADLYENSAPQKAVYYINQGKLLSEKLQWRLGIMRSIRMIAYVNAFQSKFDSMIYNNRIVNELAKEQKDTFNIGVSLFNIGVAYRFKSELDSAIEYTLKGANYLEGKGYTNIESTMYGGLQSLYLTLGQYDKSIIYGLKAVEKARLLTDKSPLIFGLNNLSLTYKETGQLDESKKLLTEALRIADSTGNKSGQALALNNLCDIAIRQNQFEIIGAYAERSFLLNKELEDDGGMISAKLSKAAYLLFHKNFQQAHALALEAYNLSVKQNLIEGKPLALSMLANIAFAEGQFYEGFKYLAEKDAYDTKVFSQSLQEKEANLRIKYETEKKDNQIKLQRAELQRRKVINYLLIVSSLAFLLIAILGFRTYQQRQKLQQQRISELETLQQLTATSAILKGEEQERTRLAKDLHDGLGGMLSGIKYSFNTMKGNLIMTPDNQQAFERSMDMLDSSIREMRRVAHNMMPEALVKFGLDTALKDFCQEINQSGVLQVTYQSVGVEGTLIDQTKSIGIYRIIQELVNNTIKHAAATTVVVQLARSGEQVTVTVEDNGKGFDTAILQQVKGIGWTNIQSRVEFLKGKLDIHSASGTGTSVHIEMVV